MSTASYYLEKAKQAADEGQTEEAIGYAKLAIKLKPRAARLWSFLGCVHIERDDYAAAAVGFERAVELGDNRAGVHSGVGRCALELGDLDKAEQAYLRSVEIEPAAWSYVLLGDVQVRLGKDAEAETSFRSALRLDPNNEEAMYNLAIELTHGRKFAEAISLLREAVRIDPDYAQAYEELGSNLFMERKWEEAESMLRKSIALDDARPWAHLHLGVVLELMNDETGAEEEYFRTADIDPTLFLPHRFLGKLYKSQGRASEAAHHLQRAAELEDADEEMSGDSASGE